MATAPRKTTTRMVAIPGYDPFLDPAIPGMPPTPPGASVEYYKGAQGQPCARVSTSEWIGPQEAAQILASNVLPLQRRLKPDWVRFYVQQIAENKFNELNAIILYYSPEGLEWLVDGQHRMKAIVDSPLAPRLLMTVIRVYGATRAEVDSAYRHTNQGPARSTKDIISHLEMVAEVPHGELIQREDWNRARAAIKLIQNDFYVTGLDQLNWQWRDGDKVISLLKEWLPYIALYRLATKNRQPFMRGAINNAPIYSVALVTFRYCPEKAQPFWKAFAENAEPSAGKPVAKLVNLYHERFRTRRTRLDQQVREVAVCWNAAYEDKRLDKIIVKNPERPLLLLGTPYKGR